MVGTTTDAFGQALLLSTFGNDATQAHGFQANVTVGLERGDVSYDLSYQLRLFRPNLTFRHSRSVTPRNNMRVDASSFSYIAETLFTPDNLKIALIGETSDLTQGLKWINQSKELSEINSQVSPKNNERYDFDLDHKKTREGWSTSSAVSFVAQTFQTVRMQHKDAPALSVISNSIVLPFTLIRSLMWTRSSLKAVIFEPD